MEMAGKITARLECDGNMMEIKSLELMEIKEGKSKRYSYDEFKKEFLVEEQNKIGDVMSPPYDIEIGD